MNHSDLQKFCTPSEIIDSDHASVRAIALELAKHSSSADTTARLCFEFVRDQIFHSNDYRMNPVTLKASDVLKNRTGFCFAKSHLLAALLRANGVPAGLCYQRILLNRPGNRYALHGLNAVYVPGTGWYRADPRGNKEGISAQFEPPFEKLAYRADRDGEATLAGIFSDPIPSVVELLSRHDDYRDVLENLPDIDAEK